jgi:hypothetical protein
MLLADELLCLLAKEINMLALIACILFVLAVFGVSLGGINLIALGLAFLAAHFVFTSPLMPWK